MGKSERYELESLLYDLQYLGFAVLPLAKLYRLLDKGNRAAGTWAALLEVWEEIDGDRNCLYITEMAREMVLLSTQKVEPVKSWAGL
jgi:hypothetical protein